jgi:4'-phosphopantetheinyl transferase
LREQTHLAALPADLRYDAFFRCWSQKEAFIKARGEGLSLPLDSFDMSLLPTERPALVGTRPDPAEASRWVIECLDVGPSHKAALAVEGAGWRLDTMQWCTELSAHGSHGGRPTVQDRRRSE